MTISRSFVAQIRMVEGTIASAIDVPFDPKEVFGAARPPVRVSIKGYTYRTTIFTMKGCTFVPFRASHREAAGVEAGDRVRVTFELDDKPRTVTVPTDLGKALRGAGLLNAFKAMSYTHQREHVEAIQSAKKPETRQRRIEACVRMVSEKGARAK
jgi:hypothetical protein